jgi:hypothetical protein
MSHIPRQAGTLPAITDARVKHMIARVRGFLVDDPKVNRLIDGEEFSDRQIYWALVEVMADFNEWTPSTNFSFEDFRHRNLLVRGASAWLLTSSGILQTRNAVSYSDGGATISDTPKINALMSWVQYLQSAYEQRREAVKRSINISKGFGTGYYSDMYYLQSGAYYGEGVI